MQEKHKGESFPKHELVSNIENMKKVISTSILGDVELC
jgi:hypothetical protein